MKPVDPLRPAIPAFERRAAPGGPPPSDRGFGAALSHLASAPAVRSVSLLDRSAQAPIPLGSITGETPTVSHLLHRNQHTRSDCWRIIHAAPNRGKAFHRLAPGTEVHLDPASGELLLTSPRRSAGAAPVSSACASSPQRAAPSQGPPPAPLQAASLPGGPAASPPQPAAVDPIAPGPNPAAQSAWDREALDSATRAYRGTAYARLNCYQLVVQGLKDLGVVYGGRDGLQARMIARARLEGRPENSYLTGEGLIDAAAIPVFQTVLEDDAPVEAQLERTWSELEGRLEPGMLLSFSTAQRGHTGVIARHGALWTLINSGHLDNDVHAADRRKGVGEEDLRAEIRGWLKLARGRGESLRLVVGRLSPEKLTAHLERPSLRRDA